MNNIWDVAISSYGSHEFKVAMNTLKGKNWYTKNILWTLSLLDILHKVKFCFPLGYMIFQNIYSVKASTLA